MPEAPQVSSADQIAPNPATPAASRSAAVGNDAADMSWTEYAKAHPVTDDASGVDGDDSYATAQEAEQPQRDEKGRFLPRSAGEKPAARAAKDEPEDSQKTQPKPAAAKAESDDRADQADEGDKQAPAGSPRALLLQARKAKNANEAAKLVDAAFVKAFGEPASAFQVNSKTFAAFREHTNKEEAKLESKRNEINGIARALEQKYGDAHRARELYEKGDVEQAIKLAFGDDWNTATKKALRQHNESDPRLDKYETELEKLRRELAERDEREQQREQQRRQEETRREYVALITSELSDSADPSIAARAQKPKFIQAVYKKQVEYWDGHQTLSAEEAAEEVLADMRRELEEYGFSPLAQATAAPQSRESEDGDREAVKPHAVKNPTGAAIPARPAERKRAPATTLRQSEAAEVSTVDDVLAKMPDGPERDAALKAKYQRLFASSTLDF